VLCCVLASSYSTHADVVCCTLYVVRVRVCVIFHTVSIVSTGVYPGKLRVKCIRMYMCSVQSVQYVFQNHHMLLISLTALELTAELSD
jgi:hypothetical protein